MRMVRYDHSLGLTDDSLTEGSEIDLGYFDSRL